MANTETKKFASPHRLVYEIAGDGTASGTIAQATLAADCVAGPLKDLLTSALTTQAAMRTSLLYSNPIKMTAWYRTVVADTTAQVNQLAVDVDTDATSTTKAEINYQIHDTTGTVAILEIEYVHSLPR